MTGKPHRPSSTDGHLLLSLSPRILVFRSTYRLPAEDARRCARPYRGTLPLGRCGD
jgi:hypothetical protein